MMMKMKLSLLSLVCAAMVSVAAFSEANPPVTAVLPLTTWAPSYSTSSAADLVATFSKIRSGINDIANRHQISCNVDFTYFNPDTDKDLLMIEGDITCQDSVNGFDATTLSSNVKQWLNSEFKTETGLNIFIHPIVGGGATGSNG